MKTRKPKLASGERVVVDISGNGLPELGAPTGVITTEANHDALPKRAFRAVFTFVLLGLVMVFLTYVVLASTVFVIMRANGANVAVLRNTFPVGQAPQHAFVYASGVPVDHTVTGRVTEAVLGVPAGSVVQIVAGPTGNVTEGKNDKILVDGVDTGYTVGTDPRQLSNEYLAICITGNCDAGKAVIIGEDSIVGEVKGYLSLSGITAPTPAQP